MTDSPIKREVIIGDCRLLLGGTDKDGYRKFVLIDDFGARCYVRRASLICTAFHGPRQRGKEVRHIDGVRANDKPENLAWSTHKENCADKILHGTAQRGERNGNSKINNSDALRIKNLFKAGLKAAEISRITDVSKTTVNNIKYGNSWGWIDAD